MACVHFQSYRLYRVFDGSGGNGWRKKGFQLWIDEFEEKRSTDMTDIDNLNVWNCVEM